MTESWFWRGTQSAIFYYVACTPWVEHKHKRKRRKHAEQAQKEREQNVVYAQPGAIRQPAPFQTNEEWAQEIVQGPGPPKGWKKDSVYHKYVGKLTQDSQPSIKVRARAETTASTESPAKSDATAATGSSTAVASVQQPDIAHLRDDHDTSFRTAKFATKSASRCEVPAAFQRSGDGVTEGPLNMSPVSTNTHSSSRGGLRNLHSSTSRDTETTGTKRSSFDSSDTEEPKHQTARPSMDRRLSYAMDGVKDAIRTALQPERWNFIRYDREDEILAGWNDKVRGMWGSVKEHMTLPIDEATPKSTISKEEMAEREAKKWQRGTHPALNDLHPPVVSQLPYTREEAQWMLMPPPSADVMMGRVRANPVSDVERRPLCVLGRDCPPQKQEQHIEPQALELANSDEEANESASSGDEEWLAGWTHLQRKQRPRLSKYRASYGF